MNDDKKRASDRERVQRALLKKALGYTVEEAVEEYASDGEELRLIKRKVSTRHLPPELTAAKEFLTLRGESAAELSDGELLEACRTLFAEVFGSGAGKDLLPGERDSPPGTAGTEKKVSPESGTEGAEKQASPDTNGTAKRDSSGTAGAEKQALSGTDRAEKQASPDTKKTEKKVSPGTAEIKKRASSEEERADKAVDKKERAEE